MLLSSLETVAWFWCRKKHSPRCLAASDSNESRSSNNARKQTEGRSNHRVMCSNITNRCRRVHKEATSCEGNECITHPLIQKNGPLPIFFPKKVHWWTIRTSTVTDNTAEVSPPISSGTLTSPEELWWRSVVRVVVSSIMKKKNSRMCINDRSDRAEARDQSFCPALACSASHTYFPHGTALSLALARYGNQSNYRQIHQNSVE